MNKEERIKMAEEFNDKFFQFKEATRIQLLTSQLNFFQVLSSIIVGLVGVLFFTSLELNGIFLVLSLVLAITTCTISTSYIREVIDRAEDDLKKTENDLEEMFRLTVEDKPIPAGPDGKLPKPNYLGEILVLLFYLSIGMLVLAWWSLDGSFGFLSYQTVITLAVCYVLSFKNHAILLSEILSTKLTLKR